MDNKGKIVKEHSGKRFVFRDICVLSFIFERKLLTVNR